MDLVGSGIFLMGVGVLFWGFAHVVRASTEEIKARKEFKKLKEEGDPK